MSLNRWSVFYFRYHRLLEIAVSFVICCICREKQPQSVSCMSKCSAVRGWYWIFCLYISSKHACCHAKVFYKCCCCFVWPEALCSVLERCSGSAMPCGLQPNWSQSWCQLKEKKKYSEGLRLHVSSLLVCALDFVCHLLTSYFPDMHSDQ